MNAETDLINCDVLTKVDPSSPAILVTGPYSASIKAGTTFDGVTFATATPIAAPASGYKPGTDYGVMVEDGVARAIELLVDSRSFFLLGGFHFAPGGNALARKGGDNIPKINPFSAWDINFRPIAGDARGMTLVERHGIKFWCDIYLLGANADVDGTSKFGARIADGHDRPKDQSGERYEKFDYHTAVAVLAAHDKSLLSVEDFFAAAYGVTEKTSRDSDPIVTGLDAPRTSKWGLMQATGNMDVWGTDGDPDEVSPCVFGGFWGEAVARCGSRDFNLGYGPWGSHGSLGARGRCDHLQLI